MMHIALKVTMAAFIISIFLSSCDPSAGRGENSAYDSEDNTSFRIDFGAPGVQELLEKKLVEGSGCTVSFTEFEGRGALEVKTSKEFCDAFIDVQSLFGYPIDFNTDGYVVLDFYVPEGSWVSAMKFNFKDSLGNFGGIPEVANNFYDNYRWQSVLITLQDLAPKFKNWEGEDNPLSAVSLFSLNPYTAHQADSSVFYVSGILYSQEKPSGNYDQAYIARPDSVANIPYEMDFDNPEKLARMMAYRSFESSFQAMDTGVAGNKTMAIRLKGSDQNKHIAFLPMFDKVTGHPVDFNDVNRIYFSYYLTEDSDEFDGSWLYLATESWDDVLLDKEFYRDYEPGAWNTVSVDVADLKLELVRGDGPVLPEVYELRLDLNYFPGKKNIEMWIDNFGWE